MYNVASEIPSSFANCDIAQLCGGNIFFNTASRLSGEHLFIKDLFPTPYYLKKKIYKKRQLS